MSKPRSALTPSNPDSRRKTPGPLKVQAIRRTLLATAIVAMALSSILLVRAAIFLPTTPPATQHFDGIGATAAATLPADFRVDTLSTVRTAGTYSAAVTATSLLCVANLSSTASNGIYNFGSGTTTSGPDRAVGFL